MFTRLLIADRGEIAVRLIRCWFGVVTRILVTAGEAVERGQTLVEVSVG